MIKKISSSIVLILLMLSTARVYAVVAYQAAPADALDKTSEFIVKKFDDKCTSAVSLSNTAFKNEAFDHKKNAEKAQKKAAQPKGESGRSQLVAFLLCFFFGYLGVHRFYLGYYGWGILFLFTGGLFLFGWLVDTILLIIPNALPPKGFTRY
jgi:hypothetical protein